MSLSLMLTPSSPSLLSAIETSESESIRACTDFGKIADVNDCTVSSGSLRMLSSSADSESIPSSSTIAGRAGRFAWDFLASATLFWLLTRRYDVERLVAPELLRLRGTVRPESRCDEDADASGGPRLVLLARCRNDSGAEACVGAQESPSPAVMHFSHWTLLPVYSHLTFHTFQHAQVALVGAAWREGPKVLPRKEEKEPAALV